MNWVKIALDETMKGIVDQQRINAELEAERLSGLQDQHEDEGLCTCGEPLDACPDAYEHLSGGV